MKEGWEYPLGHIITDHEIPIGRAPIPTESCRPLSEGLIRIRQLALAAYKAASTTVPRSKASSDASLNFSRVVRGS